MDEQYVFYPPNRAGVIFHLLTIAILALAAAWGLWQAVRASVGLTFVLYLLPFLIALLLIPLLLYRLSSLENSSYVLERDAIRLRWGLRYETIPMTKVHWVRPSTDMGGSLPLPPFRWPGAVNGTRRYPGGSTMIEYMASRSRDLLVIGTPDKLFAISPANMDNFLATYQHFTEMGSLLPLPASSMYPTILVTRLWENRAARYLILLGALLSLSIFVWVSIAIPGIERVSLGISAAGTPRTPIPSIRLMLLPILNTFAFLVDLMIGMVFFRRDKNHNLAYLLWTTSIIVSSLFLVAIYFILQIG